MLLFGICLGRAADLLDSWAERYVGTMVRDVAYGGALFVAAGDAFYDSLDGVDQHRARSIAVRANVQLDDGAIGDDVAPGAGADMADGEHSEIVWSFCERANPSCCT